MILLDQGGAGRAHASLIALDYDLRLIRSQEFIMRALDPERFDGLDRLLRTVDLDLVKQ